jgi:hypothetical protein
MTDDDLDPELVGGKELLLVDFDNVITDGNVRYWDGERPKPNRSMIQRVNGHYFAEGTVIVWTARPWSEAGRIAGHLTEWGVRYHGVRCSKGSADVYVDDKARRPEEVLR